VCETRSTRWGSEADKARSCRRVITLINSRTNKQQCTEDWSFLHLSNRARLCCGDSCRVEPSSTSQLHVIRLSHPHSRAPKLRCVTTAQMAGMFLPFMNASQSHTRLHIIHDSCNYCHDSPDNITMWGASRVRALRFHDLWVGIAGGTGGEERHVHRHYRASFSAYRNNQRTAIGYTLHAGHLWRRSENSWWTLSEKWN
jgi:hypothetical protein